MKRSRAFRKLPLRLAMALLLIVVVGGGIPAMWGPRASAQASDAPSPPPTLRPAEDLLREKALEAFIKIQSIEHEGIQTYYISAPINTTAVAKRLQGIAHLQVVKAPHGGNCITSIDALYTGGYGTFVMIGWGSTTYRLQLHQLKDGTYSLREYLPYLSS